jgi:hypothetical protein
MYNSLLKNDSILKIDGEVEPPNGLQSYTLEERASVLRQQIANVRPDGW